MAELTAIVSVKDNSSDKFQKMKESARRYEMRLESINRELDKINAKLIALTSRRWTIHLDTDRDTMGSLLRGSGNQTLGSTALNQVATGPGGEWSNRRRKVGGGFASAVDAAKEAAPGGKKESRFVRSGSGFTMRALIRTIIYPLLRAAVSIGVVVGQALAKSLVAVFSQVAYSAVDSGSKFVKALGKLGGGIGGIAAAAAIAVPAVAALSMALTVLGTLIFSLAVPLAAIIPLLTALGGALAFAVVPAFMWISNTKKLVDQKKQLREQLSRLTPGTAEYTAKLKELNEVQKDLDKNGGEYIYTKAMEMWEKAKEAIFNTKNNQMFVDTINSLLLALEPLIPIVSDLVYKFTGAFKVLFDELGSWIKSNDGESWFQRVFGPDMIKFVLVLGRGIGYLVELFGELSVAILPVAIRLFEKLNSWMDGLSKRLKSGESDLGGWLSDMMPVFTGAMSAIGAAIKGLANFFAEPEIKKFTMMFIDWFKAIIPKAISFFRDTLIKYGPITITYFKVFGKVIALLWSVLTKVFDVFAPLLKVGLDAIGVLLDVARVLLEFLAPGFEAAGAAIDKMLTPLKWLVEKLQELIDKLKLLDPRNWPGAIKNGFTQEWEGGEFRNPFTGKTHDPNAVVAADRAEAERRRKAGAAQFMGNGRSNVMNVQTVIVNNPADTNPLMQAVARVKENQSALGSG